ncbi:MAG: hypothetical protein WA708_18195 [Acidobacteriaceae bacterium]
MKKKIAEWMLDSLAIFGALGFVYGLWLAWHPLGFVVGGLLLAVVAFCANYGIARKTGRQAGRN